jgi:hypothetical protein
MPGKRMLIFALLAMLLLAACGGSSGGGDPVKTVENYLQAKIKSDKETMRGLLCSDLEKNLDAEATSFAAVNDATLQNMACTLDGDVVRCTGRIVAQYGTEQNEFPLASYKVVQEDGEWKWCGETS